MTRFRLPVLALALAALACDSPTAPLVTKPVLPALTDFRFEAAHNPALAADVQGVISGDTVRLVIPAVVEVDSLVPTFTLAEAATYVAIGTRTQHSGVHAADFTRDVTYTLRSLSGDTTTVVVSVTVLTGLPVVSVVTDGNVEVTSRDVYVPASITVYGGKDHPEWNHSGRTQIRGRGNSTWYNPKKPYRLKLAAAQSMFGFPADRDWVLLANYWDLALARNATAFTISSLLGMAYTPRCTPVEYYHNGVHQGSYQLCDHMEVAAHRIPAGTGGWLLELEDSRRLDPDETFFHSPQIDLYTTVGHGDTIPSVWIYKQPDPPTAAQRAVVEGDILKLEEVLYSSYFTNPDTGYAKYLDVRSIIDWYLVNELSKNNDAAFAFGMYVFKPADGKITFGPVWDFDLAFGNYPYDAAPEGFKLKTAGYLARLFQDPAFVLQVQARWQVLKGQRAAIDTYIRDYTRALHLSQNKSHALWYPYGARPMIIAGELWTPPAEALRAAPQTFGAIFSDADYAAEVTAMRSWLSTRFDWLDTRIMGL